jgi:Ca2+-binding EF-hand superfamily protein
MTEEITTVKDLQEKLVRLDHDRDGHLYYDEFKIAIFKKMNV